MIKPLLTVLTILVGLQASAQQVSKPVLVSGFDDVLRQSENTGLTKSALKILEKDKTFAGMPELYQAIAGEEKREAKFNLVSGISTWFHGRIQKFLREAHYPPAEFYLRNWLTEWSIEVFKFEKLKKILAENPGRQFIVIFDNSEPSLEIAEMIRTHFSDRISPVYLHQVVFRGPRAGTFSYITAFDIALNEMKFGRMSAVETAKVAQAILAEKNPELVIPDYAYCPTQYDPCGNVAQELVAVCSQVQTKIIEICKSRKN